MKLWKFRTTMRIFCLCRLLLKRLCKTIAFIVKNTMRVCVCGYLIKPFLNRSKKTRKIIFYFLHNVFLRKILKFFGFHRIFGVFSLVVWLFVNDMPYLIWNAWESLMCALLTISRTMHLYVQQFLKLNGTKFFLEYFNDVFRDEISINNVIFEIQYFNYSCMYCHIYLEVFFKRLI